MDFKIEILIDIFILCSHFLFGLIKTFSAEAFFCENSTA